MSDNFWTHTIFFAINLGWLQNIWFWLHCFLSAFAPNWALNSTDYLRPYFYTMQDSLSMRQRKEEIHPRACSIFPKSSPLRGQMIQSHGVLRKYDVVGSCILSAHELKGCAERLNALIFWFLNAGRTQERHTSSSLFKWLLHLSLH